MLGEGAVRTQREELRWDTRGMRGTKSARGPPRDGAQPAVVDCRVGGGGGDPLRTTLRASPKGWGSFSSSVHALGVVVCLPLSSEGLQHSICFIAIWRGGKGSTFLDHM